MVFGVSSGSLRQFFLHRYDILRWNAAGGQSAFSTRVRLAGRDPDRWLVKREGAHPGYINWESYLHNQEKLWQNLARMGNPTRGAAREGPALLTGLLICGRCGRRMRPAYSGRPSWSYTCYGEHDKGEVQCWSLAGDLIDAAVEHLFLETAGPSELELCLAVEREVRSQADDLAGGRAEEQFRSPPPPAKSGLPARSVDGLVIEFSSPHAANEKTKANRRCLGRIRCRIYQLAH